MLYRIEFSPRADRQFRKLPRLAQIRIRPAIDSLALNPYPAKIKKLEENVYRYRVGDFRIIYEVQEKSLTICILKMGDRKEIYRRP
jgi:mRNA interferase RelE/StbE